MNKDFVGYFIYEEIGIGILNPAPMIGIDGPQEFLDAIDEAIKSGEIQKFFEEYEKSEEKRNEIKRD